MTQCIVSKDSSHLLGFKKQPFDFTHGSSPRRFFMCLTWLNQTADGSRRKARATSHRWLPDSWVNRKEIFPCLTWLKLATDLCLVFLSTWLNTGTGPVLEEPKTSQKPPVMCPLWHNHSPQLFFFSLPDAWSLRSQAPRSAKEWPFRSVSISHTYWTGKRQSTGA